MGQKCRVSPVYHQKFFSCASPKKIGVSPVQTNQNFCVSPPGRGAPSTARKLRLLKLFKNGQKYGVLGRVFGLPDALFFATLCFVIFCPLFDFGRAWRGAPGIPKKGKKFVPSNFLPQKVQDGMFGRFGGGAQFSWPRILHRAKNQSPGHWCPPWSAKNPPRHLPSCRTLVWPRCSGAQSSLRPGVLPGVPPVRVQVAALLAPAPAHGQAPRHVCTLFVL